MDNASGSEEPGNPFLSTSGAPGSPRPSTPVVSGSPCLPVFVESTDPTNLIPDFFANVLSNPFSNFGVDVSSDLAVDPMPFLTVSILSDRPALGRFLQDDFLALALSAFDRDVPLNHPSSLGLLPLLPPLGDSTYDW